MTSQIVNAQSKTKEIHNVDTYIYTSIVDISVTKTGVDTTINTSYHILHLLNLYKLNCSIQFSYIWGNSWESSFWERFISQSPDPHNDSP